MTICCPKCASSDGRSVESIYCECSANEKKSAAVLLRQAAPPGPRHPQWWFALAVAFTASAAVTIPNADTTTVALLIGAALSGLMARDAVVYNRSILPRLLEYWHRSFMCTRCGQVFLTAG